VRAAAACDGLKCARSVVWVEPRAVVEVQVQRADARAAAGSVLRIGHVVATN